MDLRFRKLLSLLALLIVAHSLFLLKSKMPFPAVFGLTLLFCLSALFFLTRKGRSLEKNVFYVLICLFSIQFSHVILREVNYPFMYVGMYSNVEKKKELEKKPRNLYDRNGRMVVSNSGLPGSEFDDTESKLVTRLLKRNDPKIDSVIVETYKDYHIE